MSKESYAPSVSNGKGGYGNIGGSDLIFLDPNKKEEDEELQPWQRAMPYAGIPMMSGMPMMPGTPVPYGPPQGMRPYSIDQLANKTSQYGVKGKQPGPPQYGAKGKPGEGPGQFTMSYTGSDGTQYMMAANFAPGNQQKAVTGLFASMYSMVTGMDYGKALKAYGKGKN
ncbi:hypothetical protein ACFL0V_06145 [Nanoarchaeota archaeon]